MSSKSKKNMKKKYHPPKGEKRESPAPTANAKMIIDLMKSRKLKGKFKDHVIIVGSRLIDWLGSYEIRIEEEGEMKKFGVDGVALIHKSKLKNIIGEEPASKFWRNGMRTNLGVESRRTGCVRSVNG